MSLPLILSHSSRYDFRPRTIAAAAAATTLLPKPSSRRPNPQVPSRVERMPRRRRVQPQPQPQEPQPAPPLLPGRRRRKQHIPKALREALWLRDNGEEYRGKCATPWCQNSITTHDFQAGHKIPEAHGGPLTLENLVPLCSRCNLSMGSSYTFDEWCALQGGRTWLQWLRHLFCGCRPRTTAAPSSAEAELRFERTTPFLPPAVFVSNPARRSGSVRGIPPAAQASP